MFNARVNSFHYESKQHSVFISTPILPFFQILRRTSAQNYFCFILVPSRNDHKHTLNLCRILDELKIKEFLRKFDHLTLPCHCHRSSISNFSSAIFNHPVLSLTLLFFSCQITTPCRHRQFCQCRLRKSVIRNSTATTVYTLFTDESVQVWIRSRLPKHDRISVSFCI